MKLIVSKQLIDPNPASHFISFDYLVTENSAVYALVSDMSGSLVKKIKLSPGNKQILHIESLAPGLYCVNLKSNQNNETFKFVKYN